ncbi:NUDIX domain-containing protein [Streptomyces sp. yr375]|uniref:NUDIX hydrolase n=1 Tax=Streptomyces sp. yr375 TaxID=1761906 RepID=UPI0008C1AF2D|nr:NUDIX domain-containing protein [Streptomyces sp. yr375]SER13657.1 NUDIX domain-containing protein [Streptomyces sp. yr375]
MIGLTGHGQIDELVSRTHSEGITDLAAAALIEHDGKFLLIEATACDFDTPPAWKLPTGRVWSGETLVMGMHRILAEHFGFSSADVGRFLGHNDHLDDRGQITRVFVFAVTVEHPDSICQNAHVGHRWIDTISISHTLNGIDGMLRVYYADNT